MISKLSTPCKVFVTERITLESHTQVAPFRLASLQNSPKKQLRSDICANYNTQPQTFTIKVTFTLPGTAEKRLRLAAQNKYDFKVGTI